jgi:cysteinyl-tRNA synthetase
LGVEEHQTGSPETVVDALADDLNSPAAIGALHGLAREARKGNRSSAAELASSLRFLGVWAGESVADVYSYGYDVHSGPTELDVQPLIAARNAARKAKDFKESDRIRDELKAMGVVLKDNKDGTTTWEVAR